MFKNLVKDKRYMINTTLKKYRRTEARKVIKSNSNIRYYYIGLYKSNKGLTEILNYNIVSFLIAFNFICEY